MTGLISLSDLLNESNQQAAKRKADKAAERATKAKAAKTTVGTPRSKEEQEAFKETVALQARMEWRHTANTLVFTRQLCSCCDEMSATLDGLFHTCQHRRIPSQIRYDRVSTFEIDKPRTVVYRDTVVPICHNCADIQQDWPLEELDNPSQHNPAI